MNRRSLRLLSQWIVAAGMLLWGSLAFGQQATIVLDDGTSVDVQTIYSKPLGIGPSQAAHQQPPSWWSGPAGPGSGLAFYTANYNAFGTDIRFNIVGTDPALGAATTTVPTVIQPIKFVFATGTLDGTNVAAATQNSPMFLNANYTTGGTDLGTTQFGDAIQRGEFWNLPGFSTDYHVLLGTPTIMETITYTVTPANGNYYNLVGGGHVGVLRASYFDAIIHTLITTYFNNQLPIFLTDNVYESNDGTIGNGCCILGYHNSEGPPIATAQTFIYAAYTETGTFVGNVILDVQALSHEVAEWLNDPFVGAFPSGLNFIPPAILPGFTPPNNCIINFETGDPLEAPPIVFTKVTNDTTYHLQDEVFLPWYLHSSPSFSVNGWFTYLNTFTTPSTLCGPG